MDPATDTKNAAIQEKSQGGVQSGLVKHPSTVKGNKRPPLPSPFMKSEASSSKLARLNSHTAQQMQEE